LAVLLALPAGGAEQYVCVRWAWTGDVYNRKVYCLEWKRKN
jgi:hypothetical protein